MPTLSRLRPIPLWRTAKVQTRADNRFYTINEYLSSVLCPRLQTESLPEDTVVYPNVTRGTLHRLRYEQKHATFSQPPPKKYRRVQNKIKDDGARGTIFKKTAPKREKNIPQKEPMTTFQLGLKPTKIQRQAMNLQLKVTNHAYNWCLWLVTNGRCLQNGRPSQILLQAIVARQDLTIINDADRPFKCGRQQQRPWTRLESDVTARYLYDASDDWFFEEGKISSNVKLMAVKSFVSSYTPCHMVDNDSLLQCRRKSTGYYRYRTIDTNHCKSLHTGSFGVQRQYIKASGDGRLSILPKILSQSTRIINNINWWMRVCRHRNLRRILPAFGDLSEKKHGLYPPHDANIVKRPTGKFVLQLPCSAKYTRRSLRHVESDVEKLRVTSIDPGVRTFAIAFDFTDGKAWAVGTREQQERSLRISSYDQKYDSTQGELSNVLKKIRNSPFMEDHPRQLNRKIFAEGLRRRLVRLKWRIKNRVSSFHERLAHDLVYENSDVVIGDMDIGKIGPKRFESMDIHRSVKRRAGALSFATFRDRLIHRAKGTLSEIHVQEESWTSKTCSQCSHVHQTLGSNKIYKCVQCGLQIDRDVNGAMNIFFKFLRS